MIRPVQTNLFDCGTAVDPAAIDFPPHLESYTSDLIPGSSGYRTQVVDVPVTGMNCHMRPNA
ncbi:MAG TPA: hypothetical protein VFP71_04450 [Candidatus Angelobacter sp.]|nr:hypothetical protein [Candidatus Angelobacter sp.]